MGFGLETRGFWLFSEHFPEFLGVQVCAQLVVEAGGAGVGGVEAPAEEKELRFSFAEIGVEESGVGADQEDGAGEVVGKTMERPPGGKGLNRLPGVMVWARSQAGRWSSLGSVWSRLSAKRRALRWRMVAW